MSKADPARAPADNTFNDGFFRSLPKPVREVVVQHAHNVAGSSDLSRHAAMAMVRLLSRLLVAPIHRRTCRG